MHLVAQLVRVVREEGKPVDPAHKVLLNHGARLVDLGGSAAAMCLFRLHTSSLDESSQLASVVKRDVTASRNELTTSERASKYGRMITEGFETQHHQKQQQQQQQQQIHL
jgi:hypothetical protein